VGDLIKSPFHGEDMDIFWNCSTVINIFCESTLKLKNAYLLHYRAAALGSACTPI